MATTTRGALRALIASALTTARTTTDLLTTGIEWSEGVTVSRSTTPRGCWRLSSDSREPSASSEDVRDRSGEAEFTIRVEKTLTTGENLFDVEDAIADAIDRAADNVIFGDEFTHPETGVTLTQLHMTVGLMAPASFDPSAGQRVAVVTGFGTITYERLI